MFLCIGSNFAAWIVAHSSIFLRMQTFNTKFSTKATFHFLHWECWFLGILGHENKCDEQHGNTNSGAAAQPRNLRYLPRTALTQSSKFELFTWRTMLQIDDGLAPSNLGSGYVLISCVRWPGLSTETLRQQLGGGNKTAKMLWHHNAV